MAGAALIMSGNKTPMVASGSFSASGAGPTVTSAARTWTIPVPTSRELRVSNFIDVGTISALQYNVNSVGWTSCPDPTLIPLIPGDSLTFRAQNCVAGESRTFTLTDTHTGTVVETPTLAGV